MNLFSLFSLDALLIWLPGLFLIISVFFCLSRIRKGTATQAMRMIPLGLWVISLLVLLFIPNNEINKAVAFANTYDSQGEPVNSYEAIPYQAMDAFKMTAMSEEEKQDFMSYSGTEDRGPMVVDGRELIYTPQHSLAWSLLFVLFILSTMFIVPDMKKFFVRNKA